MGIFDFLKKETKTVPAVAVTSEQTRNGIHKSYIPKFLFKPPFGYPRFVDIQGIRRLASSPYVEMCISTIIDEACSIEYDIVEKEKEGQIETTGTTGTTKQHIDHVKAFYKNPNTNKESFEQIRRKYIRDILEIDSGVINKIFNSNEEMVEIAVRDGGMFTKNPDLYGFYTDREDILMQPEISAKKTPTSEIGDPGFITAADAREKAAYFQYGWNNARPVPFGKREIVWLERNGRSDSLYGRSPIQNLAQTIQTLIYAIETNLEYFDENSIPKGLIGLEGADATEILAFKEQWVEQQRKKDSAGNWKKDFYNVPIVGKKPEFVKMSFSNAEMELLEGQKWWAKMVWASFGVTATELGYTEDAKGMGNQIVQSNVFRKRAIYPLLRLEEYAHNQEIISEFGFDDVEFKFKLFDVEEETKKAQMYKLQLDAGYKSINEVRAEEGLEEVEWGDKESEAERFARESAMYDQSSPMEQDEQDEKKKTIDDKKRIQPTQKAELKFKYVKRTGSPGHYIYWYKNPKTGKLERGKKPSKQTSQAPVMALEEHPDHEKFAKEAVNKVISEMPGDYKESIIKFKREMYSMTEQIAKDNPIVGRSRILTMMSVALYNKYEDDFHKTLINCPKRYDPTEVSPEQINEWRAAIAISSRANGAFGLGRRENIIEKLREKTGNDTVKINKVLTFMGTLVRVNKTGIKPKHPNKKTKDEIESVLKKNDYKGLKYNVSPTYLSKLKVSEEIGFRKKKLSKMFFSDEEMHTFIKKTLDRLPPKTAEHLAKSKTEINFVGKSEEKILRGTYRAQSGSTGGIYDPSTKQVYIFPKTWSTTTNLNKEKMKEDGMSDFAIKSLTEKSLTSFDEKENFGQVILHEIGHAITLNEGKYTRMQNIKSSIEEAWEKDNRDKNYSAIRAKEPDNKDAWISRYSTTNQHEDMAETFAFYARYRPYLKEAVAKNKKWIHPVMMEKFKFMERLWK